MIFKLYYKCNKCQIWLKNDFLTEKATYSKKECSGNQKHVQLLYFVNQFSYSYSKEKACHGNCSNPSQGTCNSKAGVCKFKKGYSGEESDGK